MPHDQWTMPTIHSSTVIVSFIAFAVVFNAVNDVISRSVAMLL